MANKDRPPADGKAAREAKLAKALRDNLRRRKASAKDSPKGAVTEPDPS